ncbi:hypothetical protein HYPSUDRAFT_91134 [Hypholoma sublateritium FD-334 SS-4]|uniref:Uncharacterized protein n=1 Tax=Hypholoma sublateritium (strain FD-334 SS-4) TaxID=945553 RepID=A0A0D2P8R2_HYPSF|nr:hypothetical protein HYPSUDRAFT_91134 [Hypholoma sublateritium FD-334 SS-4]
MWSVLRSIFLFYFQGFHLATEILTSPLYQFPEVALQRFAMSFSTVDLQACQGKSLKNLSLRVVVDVYERGGGNLLFKDAEGGVIGSFHFGSKEWASGELAKYALKEQS